MTDHSTSLEFRSLQPEQLDRCATMMMETAPWNILHFTTARCHAALSMPRVKVVGAFRQDEFEGFAAMLAEGVEFEPMLVFLCVDAKSRGQGIGSALLDHFEEHFKDAANLYLFVADVNPGAQRFYERRGYLQVGVLPNFKLVGQTEFLYRKNRRALNV